MLRISERNERAISRIHAIIDGSLAEASPSDVPNAALVKAAVKEANSQFDATTGEQAVSWKAGAWEYTVTWVFKQDSIMEIIVQTVKAGAVRIHRKQKILV